MSNMSYCRFRNTATDLQDCYDNIDETKDLPDEEARARGILIYICCQIAQECAEGIDFKLC